MAQSGGIAQSAFNGCDKLKEIEFDFTTPTSGNLSALDADAVTALKNIYKMFAASENSFGDNGDGGIQAPTADKAWLPTTTAATTLTFNDGDKTLSSTVNGIKWSAKVTKPTTGGDFTNENVTSATIKLQSAETLEITGTVAMQGQSFKYKYTTLSNQDGNVDLNTGNNNSQALPSNIKTIKIVLKKAVPGGRLA